jgi:hypothetical protein
MCACCEQNSEIWIDDMALWSQFTSSLLFFLQTPSELAPFSGFRSCAPILLWNSYKEELIHASNYLNGIMGPTWCFPNCQFDSFPSQPADSISYPISFPSNASDAQCTKLKTDCLSMFSSSRTFHWYIDCKLSLSILISHPWSSFFCQNRVNRRVLSRRGRWTVPGALCQRKKWRREVVHFGWTRCS